MNDTRFHLAIGLLALLLVSCSTAAPGAAAQPAVFIVRHGETEGEGPDPALSEEGRRRAERLARLLEHEPIERILTTDYRRTRQTVAPLAKRLGIEPEVYDPRRLGELAAALRADGRTVLVAGHSNTTPALVAALGGDPGPPIAETEHDRLYRVELPAGDVTLRRYGGSDPSVE